MLTAIVGTNWGDEGKGRMVDLLSSDYDVVCRYQGGNNAGHTVVNDKGKFILNLLPSGILREDTVCVMGLGMVIDCEHLFNEVKTLRDKGVKISPDNLKISDRATVCMPYHKLLDCLEEDRLKDKKFGSTRRGIAPAYADRYMKKAIRFGDLLHLENLKSKLSDISEWKNLTVEKGYDAQPVTEKALTDWLETYAMPFKDYVCDLSSYLETAIENGKNVMFEAQLGSLRDIDYGIIPYTSSSYTIASYAPIGAGIPQYKVDKVIGIMKAYSSCVGEGPFTCELFGEEGDKLREAGGEYGAATGRPRRVGGFDVVASKYGAKIQGADEIALTKLDVLSGYDKIPVCISYIVDGKTTERFPFGEKLTKATPVYTYLDGWQQDISACRKKEDLPANALKYVEFIQEKIGKPIKYVSVGAEREQIITMY